LLAVEHQDLYSFPTRRSSDLGGPVVLHAEAHRERETDRVEGEADEGETRLRQRQGYPGPSEHETDLLPVRAGGRLHPLVDARQRSEEHTSELQSRFEFVCRLL